MARGDGIRRRGEGWEVRVSLGWDERLGRYRRASVTVHGTKADASRKRREMLQQLDAGDYLEPSTQSLRAYLQQWLIKCRQKGLAAKTVEGYAGVVSRYIDPRLGVVPLQKLTPAHLESLYADLLATGGRHRTGVSERTVLHVHRVLHAALRRAVRLRLIGTNPAEAAEPPRPRHREMCALDEQRARDLLRLLEESQERLLYVAVLLALNTGLRRGELLALRWSDIDLATATVSVKRSLQKTKGHGLSFKEPKTARSRRTIALPLSVVPELRRWRKERAEHFLALGMAVGELDLVFSEADGGPYDPDKLSSRYAAFRREHSVEARFHDLRHTHATLMLKAGEPVKVVADRLGHATAMLTLDTYAHVLPGMDESAAARFDRIMRANGGGGGGE